MPSQYSLRATRPRLLRCAVLAALLVALSGSSIACSDDSGDDAAPPSSSRPLAREFADDGPTTSQTPTTQPTTTTTSPYAQPSADPNIEGLTRELMASQAGGVAMSETQARCVASGMLTKLGLDPLARLGAQAGASGGQLDLNALSAPEREGFADALIGCIDLNQLMVDQLGPALGLPQASLGCVAQRLAEDGTLTRVLRQVVVSGADPSGADAALTSPMQTALDNCLSPEQLQKLAVPR